MPNLIIVVYIIYIRHYYVVIIKYQNGLTYFLIREFDLTRFSYDNYTILKELAIDDFMVNGSIYEKYENINKNMMHEYRVYISYTMIQQPFTLSEKRSIVEKLSPYLKNYLYMVNIVIIL